MKLRYYKFEKNNHFVAMEYYWLILNRSYFILITDDYLIGIQGNGIISVEAGTDFLIGLGNMAVRGDLKNPYSYMKASYFENILDVDLLSEEFLTMNSFNFRINKKEIKNVYHDSKKKWGMGYYPHDGKVYIETIDGKKRELIILGNQSGDEIVKWISTRQLDFKSNKQIK